MGLVVGLTIAIVGGVFCCQSFNRAFLKSTYRENELPLGEYSLVASEPLDGAVEYAVRHEDRDDALIARLEEPLPDDVVGFTIGTIDESGRSGLISFEQDKELQGTD